MRQKLIDIDEMNIDDIDEMKQRQSNWSVWFGTNQPDSEDITGVTGFEARSEVVQGDLAQVQTLHPLNLLASLRPHALCCSRNERILRDLAAVYSNWLEVLNQQKSLVNWSVSPPARLSLFRGVSGQCVLPLVDGMWRHAPFICLSHTFW